MYVLLYNATKRILTEQFTTTFIYLFTWNLNNNNYVNNNNVINNNNNNV